MYNQTFVMTGTKVHGMVQIRDVKLARSFGVACDRLSPTLFCISASTVHVSQFWTTLRISLLIARPSVVIKAYRGFALPSLYTWMHTIKKRIPKTFQDIEEKPKNVYFVQNEHSVFGFVIFWFC